MNYWKKDWQIQDYLADNHRKWHDREYIHWQEQGEWKFASFGRTAEDVWRISRFLLSQGAGGANIALFGRNCYEWMVCNLSILGYVGVCFPIDRQYGALELKHILSYGDISLFLYTRDSSEIIRELITEFPHITFQNMEQLLLSVQDLPYQNDFLPRNTQDAAQVLFTSGTASNPKAAVLSQQNLFHNWNALYQRTPMTEQDRILLILPLHHVYAGVAAFLYTIISGMQLYLASPDVESCRQAFSYVRPTVFISVPLIMERLISYAKKMHIPPIEFVGGRMRFLYCGGTAIEPSFKENCIRQGLPLLEAYGMTETASVIALDSPGDYRPGSAGRVLAGLDVGISRPDENGIGEIIIKGGSVMKGYYHQEAQTGAVFDSDGYFHTGDLGFLDEDGFLYLKGRKKYMLITGNGKNIYPQEVEAAFLEHPQIARASLREEDGRLHLTVWCTQTSASVEKWILERNAKLPKYQRFSKYTLTEDTLGRRLK